MKGYLKKISSLFAVALASASAILAPAVVFAQGHEAASRSGAGGMIAFGAGVAIGLAALGGTLGQGKAVSAGLDSIGRNPSAQGKLFIPLLIGLAFVEPLVIIAFVIAFQLAGKV